VQDDLSHRLAEIDIFRGLSSRQLKKLAGQVREVHLDDGHTVASEGRGALGFHLILDGEAAVSQGGTTLRTLGPGDYFGEISMIDGRRRSATVTAETPLRAAYVSHATFEELLDQDPGFARGLLKVLCARLREAESRT
jgi:CRP-like cAMP-binding protein